MAAEATPPQPFPNCTRNCDSLQIPYPFGTTEGRYLDPSFLIMCNQTNSVTSPTPFMRHSKNIVLNIHSMVKFGFHRSLAWLVSDFYNRRGVLTARTMVGSTCLIFTSHPPETNSQQLVVNYLD
ncbi:Wall-associated receptor kinase 2 [Spatholobus suberectus]|nr:Wall-associated receptor kinase 2 [Spatholobus suberectus]